MRQLLIPTTYLGSIHQYAHMANCGRVLVEQHTFYEKKTLRNRAMIMAANGPIALSVPVENPKTSKACDKDVVLAYDTPWQANHWRTIVSAYQSSPFFEYYCDDFEPFYQKRFKYLIDFNMELMQVVCETIELGCEVFTSLEYVHPTVEMKDLRMYVSPKLNAVADDPEFKAIPYRQVFGERYGFSPNLSIIDLIFCKGPETVDILQRSVQSPSPQSQP